MYLGAGLADYTVSVDEKQIADLLRQNVLAHFNNPANYKLKPGSPAYGASYGMADKDNRGWAFWPAPSAPTLPGAGGIPLAITGEYGDYYRVPNNTTPQEWVNKNHFGRLSQDDITNRIALLADSEVLSYLKGKELSWIAANLQTAINSVVANVKRGINQSGSWFHSWGLTV